MKAFFDNYIDLFTLGCGIFISLVLAYRSWRLSAGKTRLALLPFLFLAPVMIITSMVTHLFEITYHSIDTKFTGHWTFNFFLYSLYLFPCVLIYTSFLYYRKTRLFCYSENTDRLPLFKSAAVIALISLPTYKFTPLGLFPSLLCLISLLACLPARKRMPVHNIGIA